MKRILILLLAIWAVIAVLRIEPAREAIASVGRALDFRDHTVPAPSNGGGGGKGPPVLAGDGPKCLARLAKVKALSFEPVEAFSNAKGCGAHFPVMVKAVGDIDIQGRGLTLSCPAAENLAKWLDKDVPKIIAKHDKAPLTQLNHLGSYNCRKIANSRTWSQHSFANAIDVAGLKFEDGEMLSIEADWDDEPVLRDLATAACDRFRVVLTPDYNASHYDHLHFDLGPYRSCR